MSETNDSLDILDTVTKAPPPAPAPKRRVIPDLILEAMEKGIVVKISKEGYSIDGFYRSGTIDIEVGEDGKLTAKSRRNRVDIINEYDDLVRLNYYWWFLSREKDREWLRPGKEWLEDFLRLDLVEREIVYRPKVGVEEK